MEKVEDLKHGIDKTLIEDPLVRLKERMKNNTCNLEFKTVRYTQAVSISSKKTKEEKEFRH